MALSSTGCLGGTGARGGKGGEGEMRGELSARWVGRGKTGRGMPGTGRCFMSLGLRSSWSSSPATLFAPVTQAHTFVVLFLHMCCRVLVALFFWPLWATVPQQSSPTVVGAVLVCETIGSREEEKGKQPRARFLCVRY